MTMTLRRLGLLAVGILLVTTLTPTPAATPAAAAHGLPVHPRRPGWRAGAAAALVAFAVSELRAGRSPRRDVASLAELGQGEMDRGVAAAQELDRRLAASLAAAGPVVLDEDQVDEVLTHLFGHLDERAVVGRPHPGEWMASSVDVLPCAVHGYEDGPLDCLRLAVRAHLLLEARSADAFVDRVRAAGREQQTEVAGDPVLVALWTGVAVLAAWQGFAASR